MQFARCRLFILFYFLYNTHVVIVCKSVNSFVCCLIHCLPIALYFPTKVSWHVKYLASFLRKEVSLVGLHVRWGVSVISRTDNFY
ncbi:hypothetical protein GDO81_008500 [Engystomops pustulosus]|uniref:Secreted protein n=1 Tax=Engystomops pustulosus TaxID=76066 RepID=A0AAV7CF42_ENGPU|nr:hypothetical protein GDO81_008500 [Engystomops pustulosus]